MKHRLYYNKIRISKWNSIKNFKKFSNFYMGFFFIFSPYAVLKHGQFIKTFTRSWANEFFNSVSMQYFIGGSRVKIVKFDGLKFIIYNKNFFKFSYFYDLFTKRLSIDMNKKKRMPYLLAKFSKNFVMESFFYKIINQAVLPKTGSFIFLFDFFLKLNRKVLNLKLKLLKKFFSLLRLSLIFTLNIIFSTLKTLF